jgi:hypothetical protein
MGLLWLVLWLAFPYNRLRRGLTTTQANLQRVVPNVSGRALYRILFRSRGLYGFALAKALTDPVWWFYLFYLPKFLNDNYGMGPEQAKYPLIAIYSVSSVGSIAGGWLSGMRMKRGHSVNNGRKFALLLMAVCVLPIMLVPQIARAVPAECVACDCAVLAGGGGPSGLVGEPLFDAHRYVPVHLRLDGSRTGRGCGRPRRRAVYVDCEELLCAASAADFLRGGVRVPHRARSLSAARAAARAAVRR